MIGGIRFFKQFGQSGQFGPGLSFRQIRDWDVLRHLPARLRFTNVIRAKDKLVQSGVSV